MTVVRDPIIAIATAKGRASVGIIRLSGQGVLHISKALCHSELMPRHASLIKFHDENQEIIDEGLAIFFKDPALILAKMYWSFSVMEAQQD
jgi:tRNA modification GTPase